MKKFFLKVSFIAAAFMATTAHAQYAPSKKSVIYASGQLAMNAQMISKFAQMSGEMTIAAGADDIARSADAVEMAARFGTVEDAQMEANNIVMTYISFRAEFIYMPNKAKAVLMRTTLRNAINGLITKLGQPAVTYDNCSPSEENDNCQDPKQIKTEGGDWIDDLGGNGGHGGEAPAPTPGNGGWGA